MTSPAETHRGPAGWKALALLLGGSGVLHLAMPAPYESIVPKAFGDPKPWVKWSGVAELACAAGLALPRTRRVAALASAALFLAVYPANVDMTARAFRSSKATPAWKAALLARLPLQIPMVTQSLRLARRG
jgi:uncharacterized membrane protein